MVAWIQAGPTGAFVSDIFREIDEELRRDNLLKLWSRYGRYIVALAVLVLVIAGGIVAWRDHQLSERRAQSMRYSSALSLVREGKDADAAKVFAAHCAGRRRATVRSLRSRRPSCWRNRVIARGPRRPMTVSPRRAGSIPPFANSQHCSRSCKGMPDADPHSVIDRLAPMTSPGNPWRSTALELTAAARLKAGDKSGALEVYKTLADDLAAPQGMRARAAEMAAALAS